MTEEVTIKKTKAHCPTCDAERNCNVHGTIYKSWEWEDREGHSMNGGDDHSLLECLGCETIFYERSSWNSEDIEHWYDHEGNTQREAAKEKSTYPKPSSKTKPTWLDAMGSVDSQLYRILNQMYVAYDNSSYILTAIALRTALDRGTEVLGIDAAKSFEEKLNDLKGGGWIGDTEKDILGVVTDAGNAAAHRGWEPDSSEISLLLSVMEVFLQRAFIVGKKALSIKSSIPPKPNRIKAPNTAVVATIGIFPSSSGTV